MLKQKSAIMWYSYFVLVLCTPAVLSAWRYTEEAVTIDGDPCLTDCIDKECIINWEGKKRSCTRLNRPSPLYHTARKNDGKGFYCQSNCGTFGFLYEWCVTPDSWDFCNSAVAKPVGSKDYQTAFRTVYKTPCSSPCSRDTTSYYWCQNNNNEWDYCAPPAIPRVNTTGHSDSDQNSNADDENSDIDVRHSDTVKNDNIKVTIKAEIPVKAFTMSNKNKIYFVFNLYNKKKDCQDDCCDCPESMPPRPAFSGPFGKNEIEEPVPAQASRGLTRTSHFNIANTETDNEMVTAVTEINNVTENVTQRQNDTESSTMISQDSEPPFQDLKPIDGNDSSNNINISSIEISDEDLAKIELLSGGNK